MKNLYLIILFIGCLTFGLNASAQERVSQEVHEQINQVYNMLSKAYKAKNAEMIGHLYTDDCLYLPPRQDKAVEDAQGTLENFRRIFKNGKSSLDFDISFRFVERIVKDDLAYDVGYYKLVKTNPNGSSIESYGKFVTILKRDQDNIWRIHVDSYSASNKDAFISAK